MDLGKFLLEFLVAFYIADVVDFLVKRVVDFAVIDVANGEFGVGEGFFFVLGGFLLLGLG